MLTPDKGLKTELNWLSLSMFCPTPAKADDVAARIKAPTIVTSASLVMAMANMKLFRQAKYSLILEIDRFGKVFGPNKFLSLPLDSKIDGFDITLTKGRNKTELLNEMKTIHDFIRPLGTTKVRWAIYAPYGDEYITTCIDAINLSKLPYEMIKIISPNNDQLAVDLINQIRTITGKSALKIKIPGDGSNFKDIHNIIYDINVDDLDAHMKAKKSVARAQTLNKDMM